MYEFVTKKLLVSEEQELVNVCVAIHGPVKKFGKLPCTIIYIPKAISSIIKILK